MIFCDECRGERLFDLLNKKGVFTVRGRDVEIEYETAVCRECGNELYDERLDEETMKRINDSYLQLRGITLEEAINIRGQYPGMGLRPFAKVLGIGSASVSRHEAGELPSEKHIDIYRELNNDPRQILVYYEQNKNSLSPREQKKTEDTLRNWQSKFKGDNTKIIEHTQDDEEIIEAIYKPFEISDLSGYSAFSLDKFINMITFFTIGGVAKTKLMKLLWYTDFLNYRTHTVSMSGAVYTRLQYGPVPKDHDILLAHLKHMEVIDIKEEVLNEEGWVRMTVEATRNFNADLFNKNELKLMTDVKHAFLNYGSVKISDKSHGELAWIETPEEQPINYGYAMEIRGIVQ